MVHNTFHFDEIFYYKIEIFNFRKQNLYKIRETLFTCPFLIDIDDDEDEVKPSEIVICDDIESDEDPEVIEVNLCDLRPEEVKIKKSRSSKPLPMTCPICLKTFSEAKFDGHFRHAHGKPEKQVNLFLF